MDRDSIIERLNSRNFTTQQAIELLVEFARDLGHNQNDLSKLVNFVTSNADFLLIGVQNSIKHFKIKYNINSVSVDGREIYYY